MSDQAELLANLETEIQASQARAAARAAQRSDVLVKTGEHWKAWEVQWLTVIPLAEQRQNELEAKNAAAARIVADGEDRLDETEAALREWLTAAQRLADLVGSRRP